MLMLLLKLAQTLKQFGRISLLVWLWPHRVVT